MTAINLEDDLSLDESKWRGRIITLLVLLIGGAAIAGALYYFVFKSDATTVTRSSEEIPVKRATINQTLTISGLADAQLNSNLTFQSSGRIAFVNAKIGDAVREGDVLASVESDDLSNTVQQAQASQRAAQLKLDDLLDGPTAAVLSAADQSLALAESGLTKTQNDYDDLLNGASTADSSAAQQSVSLAQSQLATARAAREKLNSTPNAADVAGAESAVASAQSARTAAENSAASAQNSINSAGDSLLIAEASYCEPAPATAPAFCGARVAPISGGDAAIVTSSPGALATKASAVISANAAYLNARNSADSATASVSAAQDAVNAAQAKLDLVKQGPKSEDVAAADAAVNSASAALDAANQKLATVQQSGTDLQRSTAAAAVGSAQAAVGAAQAKRDETSRGATQNQIAQARQAVETAGLTIAAARIRLRNAQIVAPFDGVVAAVSAKVGEFGGGAGGATTATTAPIVLLTPNRIRLKMSLGETDYSSIKLGQPGVVLFDALPGKPFPFTVTEIGSSPLSSSGVVTYEVDASLVLTPGNPAPTPGMNGRGLITTDSKPDVLVVPPRAIRRRGNDQIVSVKRANGNVEDQIVTTGASDTNNVEILTGLAEGDTVAVATLITTKAGATPKAAATIPSGLR